MQSFQLVSKFFRKCFPLCKKSTQAWEVLPEVNVLQKGPPAQPHFVQLVGHCCENELSTPKGGRRERRTEDRKQMGRGWEDGEKERD